MSAGKKGQEAEMSTGSLSVSDTLKSARSGVRSGIKTSVKHTNELLASLEISVTEANSNFVSRMSSLGRQFRYVASRGARMYDVREQYGVPIVAGSATVLGGATALRRGKGPGAIVGLLAGSAAYAAVYGMPNNFDIRGVGGDEK
mmetsp:Transcript_11385/g.17098  ORF Transcript_11385/g.17098 Transcript_11385/m.17098 type:complete len:145 (-) Transcript_11385:279-713(-)